MFSSQGRCHNISFCESKHEVNFCPLVQNLYRCFEYFVHLFLWHAFRNNNRRAFHGRSFCFDFLRQDWLPDYKKSINPLWNKNLVKSRLLIVNFTGWTFRLKMNINCWLKSKSKVCLFWNHIHIIFQNRIILTVEWTIKESIAQDRIFDQLLRRKYL